MPITDSQLQSFEAALNPSNAPPSDPNWAVTLMMIDSLRKNAELIAILQNQLSTLRSGLILSQKAAIESMIVAHATGGKRVPTPVEDAQFKATAVAIDQAIDSRKSGAQIVSIAGKVLKYAAMFA